MAAELSNNAADSDRLPVLVAEVKANVGADLIDPKNTRAKHQSLHHFAAGTAWSDEQMLLRVAQWVVPEMDFQDGA